MTKQVSEEAILFYGESPDSHVRAIVRELIALRAQQKHEPVAIYHLTPITLAGSYEIEWLTKTGIPDGTKFYASPQPAAFKCKSGGATADPPQDCDWPTCGCDPYAQKVLDTIAEITTPAPAQDSVCVPEGLVAALRCQRQIDMDGTEVGVSQISLTIDQGK